MNRFEKSKRAFTEAEAFLTAANYIIQKDDELSYRDIFRFVNITIVHEVNHAFAVEMYLKCLQLIITGIHSKGHHLGKLFDKLNPEVQEKINTRYKETYQKNDEDLWDATEYSLKDLLHKAGTYFLYSRYTFEKENDFYTRYRLNVGIMAIRDIIFEYQPEFKNETYS